MAGILTAVGEAKVALSIGGTAIAFAALRIGDGNGAPIVPNRLMTDLVRRVGDAYPVVASARDPENPTHWRVTTEIPAGEGPFTCREIAVFDAAGDMIAIAAHPTVEFSGPGGDQLSIVTDIVFPVSGAANIAVTISPSVQMPITRNLRPFWLAVDSASVTAPPANPAVGASYIVPADATGAWAGQAGAVAQFTGEDWAIANVPVGHVACVIDQALNMAGRYLRRTADAWVTAEATDLAFGFARRATAAEIAAGNGNGFVTPAQMRGELDWAKIQSKPGEFPPAAHNHDDRYFTEAEADGRFVKKAGDTMSGRLRVSYNFPDVVLGEAGGAWRLIKEGNAGAAGQLTVQHSIDNFVANFTTAVSFAANGVSRFPGNMVVGNEATNNFVWLGAEGNIEICNGTYAPYVDYKFDKNADFLWRQMVSGTNLELLSNDGGTLRYPLRLSARGAMMLHDTWVGSPGQVLTTQGDVNLPARWQWPTNLQTLYTENTWYGDINGTMSRNPGSPATEGVSIMSLSVTPKRADSKLRIRFTMMVGHAGGAYPAVRIIHAGGNILTTCHTIEYSPWFGILTGEIDHPSGSTAARTIDIRLGNLDGAGTLKLNGSATGALIGSRAVLTVTEVM